MTSTPANSPALPLHSVPASNDAPTLTYTTQLTTKALRGHLFALSQFCRRVSDVTQEDTVAPSPFHSVSEPPLDLADYVIGAAVKCRLNKATVLVAIAYVGVYSRAVNRLPSILSIHRLMGATLFIAAKVLQPRHVGATAIFGAFLGVSADELIDLSACVMDELRRQSTDILPTDTQLEELYQKLEVARAKSLRGDFASAIAAALHLPVPAFTPTPPRKRASESGVITLSPSGLDLGAAASATSFLQPPPAEWGSSALPSAECSPFSSLASPGSLCSKSPLTPFLFGTVGSGIRAARALRLDQQKQPSPSQSCAFQTPTVGCYPLPSFESQFDGEELIFLLPPVTTQHGH